MNASRRKRILVVIDVQKCFSPGGGLATEPTKAVEPMADAIDKLIKSGHFDDVYLDQRAFQMDTFSNF